MIPMHFHLSWPTPSILHWLPKDFTVVGPIFENDESFFSGQASISAYKHIKRQWPWIFIFPGHLGMLAPERLYSNAPWAPYLNVCFFRYGFNFRTQTHSMTLISMNFYISLQTRHTALVHVAPETLYSNALGAPN